MRLRSLFLALSPAFPFPPPLGSLPVFLLLTWLLANVCAALRRAAQYFETETRALFREKIQQASTRHAARVAGRLDPGIPQSGWSLDPGDPGTRERDMAQRNTAANGKIVPDGTNVCLEDDDRRIVKRALPRQPVAPSRCLPRIIARSPFPSVPSTWL